MKRITTYILAVALVAGTAGCSSFLEVENIGKSTIPSFFAELSGLQSAYYGLYSSTYSFYDDYAVNYPDLASDLVDTTPNAGETQTDIYNFLTLPEDNAGYPRMYWKGAYNVVTNANNIIYYGPNLKNEYPDDTDEIDRIIAHAYFIRALMFLNLCNAYCQTYTYTADASHLGIPLPTRPIGFDDVIARSSLKEAYAQIIEDFNTALATLEKTGDSDVYYASATACQALLARVYLNMGNYDLAEQYASEVIAKVTLTPYTEYEMMFRYPHENKGKETILRLSGYDKSSSISKLYDPSNSPKAVPSAKLLAQFDDPDDIRRQRLLHYDPVYEGYDDNAHGYEMDACVKYYVNDKYKKDNNGLYGHSDPFVIRCSEMYLIRAEALCNRPNPDLDGAAADLKALIARATNKSADDIVLKYSGQDEMNSLIERERMRELCFEGFRLLDIARYHQNLERDKTSPATTKYLAYPDYRFVLPICQLEMDSNPAMKQNPGYEGAE